MKLLTLIAKATAFLLAGLVAIWFFYDYLLLAILSVIAILYVLFKENTRHTKVASSYRPEEDVFRIDHGRQWEDINWYTNYDKDR